MRTIHAIRILSVVGALCGALAAQQPAEVSARSVHVPTRLVPKAERAASDAQAIDTQRAITVTLEPQGDERTGESQRFAGFLHSQGRHVAVAVEWDGSGARARFGLDADADGMLTDSELHDVAVKISAVESPAPGAVPRAQFDLPLVVQIGRRPYGMLVRRYEDGAVRAQFMADVDYRLGEVDLDGALHTLLIIDWDDDARFGSPGDVFTFLPTETFRGAAAFGAERGFTFPAGDAALLGDRRVRLDGVVDSDGVAQLAIGPADRPLADYLQERRARAVRKVAAALADRAAEFEHDHELVPVEPGDDAPRISWLWTLDARAALEVARAAQQPLFLVYENEVDERCAQMQIYTWDDPAVVEAARPFVCARVTLELDLARSGDAFDVRLGPAYVFCDPSGRPLLYRDRKTGRPVAMTKGFKTPAEMAALLRASAERIATGAFDAR